MRVSSASAAPAPLHNQHGLPYLAGVAPGRASRAEKRPNQGRETRARGHDWTTNTSRARARDDGIMGQDENSDGRSDSYWHVSKTIPVSLILAIVLQTAGIAWTIRGIQADADINGQRIEANARTITSNFEANQHQIAQLASTVETLRDTVANQSVQLGRIEQNILSVKEGLDGLSDQLDRFSRGLNRGE